MSIYDELTWNVIPPQFNNCPALEIFFNTSSGLCSDRNATAKAKPSYELLKALYYLLPTDDYPIIKTGMSDNTLNTTIDLTFKSNSSDDTYLAQYIHIKKASHAFFVHACPDHSSSHMCYHFYMSMAVSLLQIKPVCAFSMAFTKLLSIYNENNDMNNDVFLKQLVTTHDELYYDMVTNIIQVHDELRLYVSRPKLVPDSISFQIHPNTPFSKRNNLLTFHEDFNTNMEQLSDLIIAGIL